MEPLLWLDVPLLLFGITAVLTAGWLGFRSSRAGSAQGSRRPQTLTVLLVVGGLASLVAASVDQALAVRDDRQRPLDGARLESSTRFAGNRGPVFEAGAPAPDFALPSLDGRSYRLSDFQGRKPVLLTLGSFG